MNDRANLILEAKNITKSFHEGNIPTMVLQGIDLSLKRGEQIAIMGSSGSGKSTLLSILGALASPTSGEVWVYGQNMTSLTDSAQAKIRNLHLGFVYQFHHLLPEFTALENVALPLLLRQVHKKEAVRESKILLDRVGLSHRYDHKPSELSGGERQRVAIARALVTKPSCLLADEPTGNLDQNTAQHVYELILELNKEYQTSILIATHDLQLAQRMHSILTMVDGKIVK